MSDFSPCKGGVGLVQNYMSLDSPTADARSSRDAIKDELVGKLVFDDARIFNRLSLDSISSQFVTKCTKVFAKDQNLLHARRELDTIIADALGKPIDRREESVVVDEAGVIRKVRRKTDEKRMYGPLRTIFQHIESFPNSSDTIKRSFESTDSTILNSDSSTWGFPKVSPDFGLFEYSSPTATTSGQKHVLWRQNEGFCNVKPTSHQGPKRTESDGPAVQPIISQAADYARLHLSARPFQLFSVGLLIFGSEFCVAIFDRDGVVFSPIHDMWKDLGIFVRVVRSLTCHMPSIELGQDPTVTILPYSQQITWRNQTKGLGREAPTDFPTYLITTGEPNSPSWYTVGLPIWASVSLLGRGTSVWLVRENGTGPVLILKNTWRRSSRLSESIIYGSINGDHPALAKFYRGQDVLFPHEQRHISTGNLRDSLSGGNKGDIVLHRLLLKSRGRPLWEYRSEKELLQGIRAALSAHEFLCAQGILHCDISAGNIMLPVEKSPEAGMEGFLMDLEFARLERSSLNITRTVPVPPVRMPGGGMTSPTTRSHTTFGPDVMRGAAMTGTAQFMAAEILGAILSNNRIVHEPRHDIESFILVLAYSVVRRAVLESRKLDDETRTSLHKFFYSTFGRMSLDDIWASRTGYLPLLFYFRFPALVSAPMSELMAELRTWLRQSEIPSASILPVTHAYVLSLLDKAIEKMA